MQHGDCHDCCNVKPECDIDMALSSMDQGHDEVATKETKPNNCDCDINRPFEFGVFFPLGDPEGQGERCGEDDQLPTPEVELGE